MKKTLRVFTQRTSKTPDDSDVRIGMPGLFDVADAIDISVTFTWDIPYAERLARCWGNVAPVSIGGPAFGSNKLGFTPGKYVKTGCVITSRGCPNNCWFCFVPKRFSGITELPISDGYDVFDDNLLACSKTHVKAVFEMLHRQKKKPIFSGGLDATLLKPWHVEWLARLNPSRFFFAYDNTDNKDAIYCAGRMLQLAGFNSNKLCCYVLVGYPRDTIDDAFDRIKTVYDAGFMPFAMLYRDDKNNPRDKNWSRFARQFIRPAITKSIFRNNIGTLHP